MTINSQLQQQFDEVQAEGWWVAMAIYIIIFLSLCCMSYYYSTNIIDFIDYRQINFILITKIYIKR